MVSRPPRPSRLRHRTFRPNARPSAAAAARRQRLDLDERVVAAGVVFELALVDAEEEASVARRVELAVGADGDELVVVVADDGDERPRVLVAHQLLGVHDARQPRRRREAALAQAYAARRGDAKALTLPDHQAGVRPAVGGVVGADADADREEGGLAAAARGRRRSRRGVGRVGAAGVIGRARVVAEDGRALAGGLARLLAARGRLRRGLRARVVGRGVVGARVGGARGVAAVGVVELDGLHVVEVDDHAAAARAAARGADEDGEQLVAEGDDLAADDLAV